MGRGRGRGGGNRSRGRGGNKGRGGGANQNNWSQRGEYQDIQRTNALFERYYNEMGIIPSEQREEFWSTMRRELPNSFRFTGSKGHALSVQQRLIDHYIPEIVAVKSNGEFVPPPTQLEWFPEKLAWSMTTPKQVVRKFPPFKNFQKFLVSETSVGNISRQEVVSMIPPLVMDLQPGMTVLDLCAAPGSKSAQLIEMVHKGEEARTRKIIHQVLSQDGREISPDGMEVDLEKSEAEQTGDWSDDGRATGLLIANDINYTRAQMLVHQVKRLNSPNLIVTNHDASMFPSIRIPSEGNTIRYLKFDRILADVPCSGDGTCRKNYSVWKDWTPGNGIGLHAMQQRILVRALQMLKKGGRVVYSTCSMNPIENEAVVASAIYRCGGVDKVSLLDTTTMLPGLKRVPGLKQWKVMDKQGEFWESWEDFEKNGSIRNSKFAESHFAPSPEENIPLGNCMRVYPHLQDTGGFFIAVLEKVSEIRELVPEGKRTGKQSTAAAAATLEKTSDAQLEDSNALKRPLDNDDEAEQSVKRAKVDDGNTEVPVIAGIELREDSTITQEPTEAVPQDTDAGIEANMKDAELPGIAVHPEAKSEDAASAPPPFRDTAPSVKRNATGPREEPYKYLDENHPELVSIYDFYQVNPRFPRDRWMVRNAQGEPAKAMYYTSAVVRDILQLNEGRGMKFVQSGIKMFMKQDAQGKDICRWRIQSEGLPMLESWVGEDRVVRLYKRSTLHKLLKELFPKITEGRWQGFAEIGERVRDIGMGCCVLRVEPSDAEDGFKERFVMPLWRSVASINIMLSKEDRRALLLRIYNDHEELIDHSEEKKRDEAAAREANAVNDDQDGAEGEGEGDDVPATENNDDNDDEGQAEVVNGAAPVQDKQAIAADGEAQMDTSQLETVSAEQVLDSKQSLVNSERDQAKEQGQGMEVAPGVTDEPTDLKTTAGI